MGTSDLQPSLISIGQCMEINTAGKYVDFAELPPAKG